MRSTSTTGALFVAFAACLSPDARADEPRQHEGGFFLRLAPGGGFSSTKITEGPDTLELRGVSGSLDVAIGAVIKRNLAIHGNLGGWAVLNPTAEFNGVEEDTTDLSVTLVSYGAGFTYYFGDSNAYLTASAGAAQLRLEIDGDNENSDTGFALDVGLGKEWWVGDRWGLGLSGTVGYHSVPPGDADNNFKGPSFAVRLSATFN